MPKTPPLVHLFDCHVYIFRSYFVMPEMTAPDGRPTQAAYGFANTLIRYLKEEEPTHVAACFDFAMDELAQRALPGLQVVAR